MGDNNCLLCFFIQDLTILYPIQHINLIIINSANFYIFTLQYFIYNLHLKQQNKQHQLKIMSSPIISDSQKSFIISSIQNNFRVDGRSNTQPQKYIMKVNNLDHLLGSCLVNVQTSQNQVHIYCGIKVRVEKLSASKKDSSAKVNIKDIKQRVGLEVGCIKKLSQQEEQTRAYIEQYLTKYIVDRHLNEFQSLLSIPNAQRHCLSISIQTYILSTPHISYLQHLYLCVKTALQNMEMPKFTVAFNEITDEEVVDVTVEEGVEGRRRGKMQGRRQESGYQGLEELKIVGVLGQTYVLGMTAEQYEAVDSCLLIAFDKQKQVTSFQSLKGTTKVQDLHQIIKFAKQ